MKNGLAAAKARGKRIGRERKRNSALIESLLDAGLTYREIARISKCSHGSVHAQKKELLARRKEEERQKRLKISQQMEINSTTDAISEMKTMNIPEDAIKKAQENLESHSREQVREIQGGIAYETMD